MNTTKLREVLRLISSNVCMLICMGAMVTVAAGEPMQLFVATNGNDTWSGRLPSPNTARTDGPFATLERARDAVRALRKQPRSRARSIVVQLRAGTYELNKPFALTAADSGQAESPVTYGAFPNEQVTISGGRSVSKWKPVVDPSVLARLDEQARGHVYQADLSSTGLREYGSPGGNGVELYFNERPMTLARWPNDGFVKITDLNGNTPFDVRGTPGDRVGKFTYEGDRPRRWTNEDSIWLHGFWFWDWSDERQEVESIDVEKRMISLKPPFHRYGYRKGQWYYAYNVLAELDAPGEWYLDRRAGILYFWPPSPIDAGRAVLSALQELVTLQDASYVQFRGLRFGYARGTAVRVRQGRDCLIDRCTLSNIGGSGIHVSGGQHHGVTNCVLYQLGDSGIALSGGDRKTLTPGGHFADNNHIHDYGLTKRTYSRGIGLGGVGNRASHNLIHDAPHQAIAFNGNDHIIEFNEIHDVCRESNDAGAIYAGRNWTMRGTVIRYNYMHDISGFEQRGCVGVYLDDMYCGTEIRSNVFVRVTRAAFIGGGRDNVIANNIFVDCRPAIHVDARAMGWAREYPEQWTREGTEQGTLLGIRFADPPYSKRYPQLVNILDEQPAAPRGNVIEHNISSGGKWDEIQAAARPFITIRDNLIDEAPGFVDRDGGNYQLRDDSPAWKLGFQHIPIEKIGLLRDGVERGESP